MKMMDLNEFVENGFLQEANRLFFHPHGLALVISKDDNGNRYLRGIWDCRDDPEGIYFKIEPDDINRAELVAKQREFHYDARVKKFGSWIQPCD